MHDAINEMADTERRYIDGRDRMARRARRAHAWRQVDQDGKLRWVAEWQGQWQDMEKLWGWDSQALDEISTRWGDMAELYGRRKLSAGVMFQAVLDRGLLGTACPSDSREEWTRRFEVLDEVTCMEHRITRLQVGVHLHTRPAGTVKALSSKAQEGTQARQAHEHRAQKQHGCAHVLVQVQAQVQAQALQAMTMLKEKCAQARAQAFEWWGGGITNPEHETQTLVQAHEQAQVWEQEQRMKKKQEHKEQQ